MIKKNPFDLIIFDVMLPDMSGVDVFETAKQYHYQKKLECKYVFLSIINPGHTRKTELIQKGAIDYIQKPFKKEDLVNRISCILN